MGFTPEGAPIIQFLEDPGVIKPQRGIVIGRGDSGQVIVAFRNGMTTISDNSNTNLAEKSSAGDSSDDNAVTRPPPVVRIASPSPTRLPV